MTAADGVRSFRGVQSPPSGLDQALAFQPLPSERARCGDGAGTLAPLFFSDDDVDIARAKAICGRCSLRVRCLEGALERGEVYGVWGGQLLIDGEPVRFARRRGRPPAHRVEVLDDEVVVPDHLVA
jgi:WhiB family redox-sensing transcriptional regulator